MLILKDLDALPEPYAGGVIAIGNFDGVHRGHQALIARVRTLAKTRAAKAGVLIFEPHPRAFFRPDDDHFEITPLPRKLELLDSFGLDLAAVRSFNRALSELSAEDFIEQVLQEWLKVAHVVVGYDFFFGHKRSGTPETLKAIGLTHGFGVDVIAPQAEAGETFSSSAIRAKLSAGNVAGAARDLGTWWRVRGPVVGGAQRGTPMGFPTANVVMPKGTALGHGIFAVRVVVDGTRYDAAAYLGTRPTFDDGKPVLEVFLLDFSGNLYGKDIDVIFIAHIRPDRKFDSTEALIAQMEVDCDDARKVLAAAD
ncbi:MAG: bifunctional riboflavin kinase/FAD synthetase [Pseudomonadota bacterium]